MRIVFVMNSILFLRFTVAQCVWIKGDKRVLSGQWQSKLAYKRSLAGVPFTTPTEFTADRASPRQVPSYDVHEFKNRQSRYAVLIPVLEEGERILNQLRRMEFLHGKGVILGDGGSKDSTGDVSVLKDYCVRTLLIKTSAGKQSVTACFVWAFGLFCYF